MKHKYRTADFIAISASAAIIIAFYAVCRCPFKFFFGIPCPGCGMLRAAASLLKLDFAGAFHYHPLIFIMPPAACVLLARLAFNKRLPPKAEKILSVFIIALFLAVYIIRLAGGSDVVKADPNGSVLHKIISFFTEAV